MRWLTNLMPLSFNEQINLRDVPVKLSTQKIKKINYAISVYDRFISQEIAKGAAARSEETQRRLDTYMKDRVKLVATLRQHYKGSALITIY